MHLIQELEYAAKGFFALLDNSLLLDTPVCPSVADFLSPVLEEDAAEP